MSMGRGGEGLRNDPDHAPISVGQLRANPSYNEQSRVGELRRLLDRVQVWIIFVGH